MHTCKHLGPNTHIAEHKASWYTQAYADVISTNTIATIGFLCAFSNGNDSINVPVFLAEARHLRRVYIAVGPVPVYAIEHNFFHQLADALQESNRTVSVDASWNLPKYFGFTIFALCGHFA